MSDRQKLHRVRRCAAFSLIELVIVVVIIGIIAAIAVPRLSRGAAGAADSSVAGDLTVIREAVEHYAAEHNGNYPDIANVTNALTGYTDENGNFATPDPFTKDSSHPYGPYLRAIPPLPVGTLKGANTIGSDATTVGWLYDPTATPKVRTNTTSTDLDTKGKQYSEY